MNKNLLKDQIENIEKHQNYSTWIETKNNNPKLALEIARNINEASKSIPATMQETYWQSCIIESVKNLYNVLISRNQVGDYRESIEEYTRTGNFKGTSQYWINKLRRVK